jgi:hypothetical protein
MEKNKIKTYIEAINKRIRKTNGITLIALVITIIVMLILAGVSLNATIGNNGIITMAQSATYAQSVATLQDYLNQEYVNLYLDNKDDYSKLEVVRKNHTDWFYNPTQTGLTYILLNGHMYFLIEKDNLPEEVQKSLKGGDAGEKTYQDYANFKDVYGVTSDLKVYYCSDGLDSIIGAADELLEDSATREAIAANSDSGLANYLAESFDWIKTDANGNVLAENLSAVKELTIDSNSVKSLKELYNLSSLTDLNIKDAALDSLEGIESIAGLKTVTIENSTCGDYTSLSNCSNVTKLYLTKVNQSEATGVLEALTKMDSSKIEYFGIYNSPNVTDITKLDQASSAVKASIKYLYLYNDSYTTASFTDFNNLYELKMFHDIPKDDGIAYYTDLKSITNLKSTSLQYLYCQGNYGLESISNVNVPNLVYLSFQYDFALSQASIDDFSESTGIKELYLYRASNITNVDSIIYGNIVLERLYIARTNVSNIKKLKGNTTLTYLYAYDNTSFTTLEGLEYCTNLYYVHCSGCTNLGNGSDTTKNDDGTYTALGKSSTNALYSLSNKTNLYYLNLSYGYYLKYFSYLKDSGLPVTDTSSKPVNYCGLYGCNQLDGDEVSQAKAFLNKCGSTNIPVSLTLYTLDDDTTAVRLIDATITDTDFRTLKEKTNIQTLIIGNMTIKNSSTGKTLTTAELNSLFDEVLSTMTGITQLYIYQNISEITFVKKMNNLQYLMLNKNNDGVANCKVGTIYTDSSGNKYHQDSEGNPTGLELLNTYCPNLRVLRIWNYTNDAEHYVDLSKIQPTINKMNTWQFADNYIDDAKGLWTNRQWIADTMAYCTEITNFYSYHLYGMTYDLSNCKSLKNVYVRTWDGEWIERESGTYTGHIKLPTSYTAIEGDTNPGYYVYLEYPTADTILSGGAGCREICIKNIRGNQSGDGDDDAFANMFTGLNQSYLKKITIYADESFANFVSSNFLKKLQNCTSLSEIYFYGYQEKSGKVTDISPISTMTGLTKVYFNKTRISSIPDISNLSQLTYLYIQNANVTDISGLYKDNKTTLPLTELWLNNNSISNLAYLRNLTNLKNLDLRNNSIGNTVLSSLFGTVDNVEELNTLKSKDSKLSVVYVRSGNKFEDTSGLSWTNN